MWAYIVRRILWTIPIVLGVVLLTFTLFTLVAKDPARQYAGKHATPEVLAAIRHQMGLDKAVWLHRYTPISQTRVAHGVVTLTTDWAHDLQAGDSMRVEGLGAGLDGRYTIDKVAGEKSLTFITSPNAMPPVMLSDALLPLLVPASRFPTAFDPRYFNALFDRFPASITYGNATLWPLESGRRISIAFDSQFFDALLFRFPNSMRYGEPVSTLFWRKAPISLAIQLPVFIIELGVQLLLALLVASYRGRWPDYTTTFIAVLGMSVPALSIYLGAQWLLAAHWRIFPVAGWDVGFYAVQFAALPILVSVVGNIGAGTRFYRTVVLEEINADYVRTARSKGVASREVLLTHVMRNVMIPVITNTVSTLPLLLLGALILERLFQIPGVAGLLVESVFNNDRPVVMATTYMLSIVYCVMLLVTDICYTLADPRVKLS